MKSQGSYVLWFYTNLYQLLLPAPCGPLAAQFVEPHRGIGGGGKVFSAVLDAPKQCIVIWKDMGSFIDFNMLNYHTMAMVKLHEG